MAKDKNTIGKIWRDGLPAFGLNFLLAVIVFGYYIIKEHGLFSLSYDFNSQIIPFTKHVLDMIHNNGGIWSWNIDLGSNIVSALSYYSLGSPVFWLFSWCTSENVLYIMGIEYILKYAIAGLSSYYYLTRHIENKRLALIGSVLYSFSGFQTVNILFIIFHDAVALFPLLLISFEEMIEDDRRGWFAVTVFINAIVNYYCFIGEIIFLIIYFILRYLCSDFKYYIRKLGVCIAEGILGILMASVLFIPSMVTTLKNSRVSDGLGLSYFLSIGGRRDLLQYFVSFMYPSEMMMQRSYIYSEDWTSRSAYLPMIGVSLDAAYLLKKKKHDWLKRILVVLTVLMIFPFGNGLFSLFTTNYCRWFYMPILFMVLASLKAMENLKEYKAHIISLSIAILLILQYFLFGWWNKNKFELIFIEKRFNIITLMGISGIVLLFLICQITNKKIQQKVLLIMISLYAVITTSYTCNLYQIFDGTDSKLYQDRIEAINQLEPEDGCRYLTDEDNLSMLGGFSGINSFISTVTGSIPEFWESLGLEKKIFSPIGPDGTNELLSVKYMICEQPVEDYELVETYAENEVIYYLYKMPYSLNIGYTYDTYLSYDEFISLPPQIRAVVMLKTLIVKPQEIEQMKDMKKLQISDVESLTEADIPTLVEEHKKENTKDFAIQRDKFSCNIDCTKNKYAFFSVPYDGGWSAKVNGKSVEIINVNGLMAIPIEKGYNQIEFCYFDKIFFASILISIISFGILVCYMHKSKNRSVHEN